MKREDEFNLIHRIVTEARREAEREPDKENSFILHKSMAIKFHNPYKQCGLAYLGKHTHTHAHSLHMAKAGNSIMYQLVLRLYAAEEKEKGEVLQKKKKKKKLSYCLVEVSLPQQVRLHRVPLKT